MMRLWVLFLFVTTYGSLAAAQGVFHLKPKINRETIPFESDFNLIIIDAKVNGKPLKFILDSGVRRTILFNLGIRDSLDLNAGYKTTIRGFGESEPIEAYVSKSNEISIGNSINDSADLIYINADNLSLVKKLGKEVNGIIGSAFFKEQKVEIDYYHKRLRIYNNLKLFNRRIKKFTKSDLTIKDNRSYLKGYATHNDSTDSLNLLIDTGSTNALWIYSSSATAITKPDIGFPDYLGWGLSGRITGWRSKIESLQLNDNDLKGITTSFPDDNSTINAQNDFYEDGLIGGEILRRFIIILDYEEETYYIKPYKRLLKEGFYYNLSGLTVTTGDRELIEVLAREKGRTTNYGNKVTSNNNLTTSRKKVLQYVPTIYVDYIADKSPASTSGLKVGDRITHINNVSVRELSLARIAGILRKRPGNKVSVKWSRDGNFFKSKIVLKEML